MAHNTDVSETALPVLVLHRQSEVAVKYSQIMVVASQFHFILFPDTKQHAVQAMKNHILFLYENPNRLKPRNDLYKC